MAEVKKEGNIVGNRIIKGFKCLKSQSIRKVGLRAIILAHIMRSMPRPLVTSVAIVIFAVVTICATNNLSRHIDTESHI